VSAIEPGYWGDVLEGILSVACQSLSTTPLGQPSSCYVSQNRPPADCCDLLAVWTERFRPTIKFPIEYTDYDRCLEVRQMMDVVVTLLRPCWPVVVDNARSPFPDPADIDSASTSLAIDIQALWGGLVTAYAAGALIVSPRPPDYIKWGQILPMHNEGGCAGWELRMTIDLDPCA